MLEATMSSMISDKIRVNMDEKLADIYEILTGGIARTGQKNVFK